MISYYSWFSFAFSVKALFCIFIIQHCVIFLNSINKYTPQHLFLLRQRVYNFFLINRIFYLFFSLLIYPFTLPAPFRLINLISALAPARTFSLHESQFSTLHSAPKEKKDEKFHAAATTSLPSLRY